LGENPAGGGNKAFPFCVYIWFSRQREKWKLHKEKQAGRVCTVWSAYGALKNDEYADVTGKRHYISLAATYKS
jgi:hypothetical protein